MEDAFAMNFIEKKEKFGNLRLGSDFCESY